MKARLALDIDGTALDIPYIPTAETNFDEYVQYWRTAPGLEHLLETYDVYFISARSFPGAFKAAVLFNLYKHLGNFKGLLTDIDETQKAPVARELGCIALVDNHWQTKYDDYTILIDSPWLRQNLVYDGCTPHIVEGLDDPDLLDILKSRERQVLYEV